MINLLQGDCMDLMRSKPDKFYDLAIVDPPYFDGPNKLGYYGAVKSKTKVKRQSYNIIGSWDIPQQPYFDELYRTSKHQIIWGINYYEKYCKDNGRIVWDKVNDASTFSDGEIASCSLIDTVRFFRFMWNGMLQQDMKNKEVKIHPTQKPIALYKWLLTNYAKQGQTILDTHGGSFSHAIAAYDLGFDLDIIELDTEYFKDGKARFDAHVTRCEEIKQLGYAKTAIQNINPILF